MNVAEALPRTGGLERRRGSVIVLVCWLVTGAVAVLVVTGTALAPHDPAEPSLLEIGLPPSSEHWLGTDHLGRDVLSRLIAGARTPLFGALVVAVGAGLIGSVVGIAAGYRGGWLDTGTMRWVDLMLALPGLLVAIVVVSVIGSSIVVTVGVLVLFFTPWEVRVMRGLALEQRSRPYVEAARTAGLPPWRIMARHIWPNTLPIVVVDLTLNFAFGLIALASLSFLGIGGSFETPDWGRMMYEARSLLFENPAAAVAPALMIAVTASAVSILGDAWYERLSARGRSR